MFRTDGAALTYKSTLPDSFVAGDDFLPGVPALVPGVHVVPLAEGYGCRSNKGGIESINGTGRITEHTVNTHRVLFKVSQ
ncbi:uncharacterized protein METZ01_LOCUS300781, partial [marine metagenome]